MSAKKPPVIASQAGAFYFARMAPGLLRLVTMIAALLMPFGMAAAPAAPASGHHAAMASPTEHCPQGAPAEDTSGAPADCAMPCSAALPAADFAAARSDTLHQAAAEPALEGALAGILLEIATPPPKPA